ncbi:helix-turn-helix domain-containing protein [Rhodococcus erythropolis]|uniref:Putative repressor protein n=1 Tax=Rhodococcus erythropolis TaxID=1833 RepID=A0A2Z5U6P1_RHOER|nr:helix-turn-helix domain-containing protein [Rhodococcus erythropolis]BBA94280.1 putative repressor protein [Rhodococcus erythropolis]BBE49380.1 hypothetical excisionase protein [Rhodococcus erythropolis]
MTGPQERKRKAAKPSREPQLNCCEADVPKRAKQPPVPSTFDLLTVKETAGLLRVSQATLYRLLRSGEGPTYTRIGGQIRVHRESLRRFIEPRG